MDMENKSVYVLIYSSTNEDSAIPYVECLGVYCSKESAMEELERQYNAIIEDEFGDASNCDIKKTHGYFAISDKWCVKDFMCVVEERKIDSSNQFN